MVWNIPGMVSVEQVVLESGLEYERGTLLYDANILQMTAQWALAHDDQWYFCISLSHYAGFQTTSTDGIILATLYSID